MAKTIFEEMGGTYTQVGDYLLPDLKLPEEEQQPIGVWGQRHRRYLKEHRRASYAALLTSGKLNGYLADIDRQAEEMFLRLVKQMAEAEGVTEQLKADNQMEWVGRMNNIRNRAMEIVNSPHVYVETKKYPERLIRCTQLYQHNMARTFLWVLIIDTIFFYHLLNNCIHGGRSML